MEKFKLIHIQHIEPQMIKEKSFSKKRSQLVSLPQEHKSSNATVHEQVETQQHRKYHTKEQYHPSSPMPRHEKKYIQRLPSSAICKLLLPTTLLRNAPSKT